MNTPAVEVDPRVRRQAIAWFVLLSSGEASERDRRACEDWLRKHPQHEYAWSRLHAVRDTLGSVPSGIAAPTLQASSVGRRTLLKGIALLAAAGWRGANSPGSRIWPTTAPPTANAVAPCWTTAAP